MEEYIEKEDEKTLLYKAITCLKDRERKVIKYYFYNELNQEEIAKLVGVSQAQISRILIRAVNKLRVYLLGGSDG